MSEPASDVPALDGALVQDVARGVLGSDAVRVIVWEIAPITHVLQSSTTSGVWRLTGVAEAGGMRSPFAAVLKIVQPPDGRVGLSGRVEDGGGDGDPGHCYYWRREFEAYRSGLLTELPEPFTAPRYVGSAQRSDGTLWLWLEEVEAPTGASWKVERYAAAAHALGVFNGTYAATRSVPDRPWLSRSWLRQWVEERAGNIDLLRRSDLWALPIVRAFIPDPPVARIVQVWDEREALLSALEQLPLTLCHFDPHAINLFARHRPDGSEEIVAIDWAHIGPGAVGQDLAVLVEMSLVMSTGRRLPITPADAAALERVAWPSYLAGLKQAGWTGDERAVRFAYVAHASLQCLFIANVLRQAADPQVRQAWDERFGSSFDWRLRMRMRHMMRLPDLADEARSLLPDAESLART